MELTAEAIDRVVRTALAEDVGGGDRTTDGIVPAGARCRAAIHVEEDAGVIRSAEGLERLRRSPRLLPRLVAECALARRESRGAHFRSDFPTEDPAFLAHVVLRRNEPAVLEAWS